MASCRRHRALQQRDAVGAIAVRRQRRRQRPARFPRVVPVRNAQATTTRACLMEWQSALPHPFPLMDTYRSNPASTSIGGIGTRARYRAIGKAKPREHMSKSVPVRRLNASGIGIVIVA